MKYDVCLFWSFWLRHNSKFQMYINWWRLRPDLIWFNRKSKLKRLKSISLVKAAHYSTTISFFWTRLYATAMSATEVSKSRWMTVQWVKKTHVRFAFGSHWYLNTTFLSRQYGWWGRLSFAEVGEEGKPKHQNFAFLFSFF